MDAIKITTTFVGCDFAMKLLFLVSVVASCMSTLPPKWKPLMKEIKLATSMILNDYSSRTVSDSKSFSLETQKLSFNDPVLKKLIKSEANRKEISKTSHKSRMGTLLVNESKGQVVLSVRGTVDEQDMAINFDMELVKMQLKDGSIDCHKGFLRMALMLFKSIHNQLESNWNVLSNYQWILSGHSMGGAVSLVLREILFVHGAEHVKVVSLGAPKVFANIPKKRNWDYHLRIARENDPVPLLPPFGPFKHVGKKIVLEKHEPNGHSLEQYFIEIDKMEQDEKNEL